MTVEELIAILSDAPLDARVMLATRADRQLFPIDDVSLVIYDEPEHPTTAWLALWTDRKESK